jgi:hypothetical protein
VTDHVSERHLAAARKKIADKVKLLEKWKAHGVPPLLDDAGNRVTDARNKPLFDYFPDDKRAFCAWTAKDNCSATIAKFPEILEFATLSRSTLGAPHNTKHLEKVETLTKGVLRKVEAQTAKDNLKPELDSLRKELNYWKQIAIETNNDLVHQRRLAARAQSEWRRSELAREHNNNLLNEQIARLTTANAELTAQLAKIRPLSSKGKK